MHIFLGGSLSSSYREIIIPILNRYNIKYSNDPQNIVLTTKEIIDYKKKEEDMKRACDTHFYCLTPKAPITSSILEVFESLQHNKKVICYVIKAEEGYTISTKYFESIASIVAVLPLDQSKNLRYHVCERLRSIGELQINDLIF